jgi:sodium/proline symporter
MLPSFLCGIVVSGILAASMSSASSYLLITGSSVAENIFRSLFKKDATDNQVLIVSRITLLAVLLFGIWIAWDENSVIFMVVSYAWAGLGASFGPLTLFSLYWRRTTKQGAIAGMVTGAATVIIWHNFIKPMGAVVGGLGGSILGMYELLPAFLLGCLAIFVVSKLTPEPEQAVLDTFDTYMVSTGARRNLEEVLEENLASDLPEYAATTYPHDKKE